MKMKNYDIPTPFDLTIKDCILELSNINLRIVEASNTLDYLQDHKLLIEKIKKDNENLASEYKKDNKLKL